MDGIQFITTAIPLDPAKDLRESIGTRLASHDHGSARVIEPGTAAGGESGHQGKNGNATTFSDRSLLVERIMPTHAARENDSVLALP